MSKTSVWLEVFSPLAQKFDRILLAMFAYWRVAELSRKLEARHQRNPLLGEEIFILVSCDFGVVACTVTLTFHCCPKYAT